MFLFKNTQILGLHCKNINMMITLITTFHKVIQIIKFSILVLGAECKKKVLDSKPHIYNLWKYFSQTLPLQLDQAWIEKQKIPKWRHVQERVNHCQEVLMYSAIRGGRICLYFTLKHFKHKFKGS